MSARLTIRDLAERHGVTLRTIRFYEMRGLLSPQRDDGAAGHPVRSYTSADADKLGLILQAAALGFTLREIRDLLAVDTKTGIWELMLTPDRLATQLAEMNKRAAETAVAIAGLTALVAQLRGAAA